MTIGRIAGTAIFAVSLCGLLLVGGFAGAWLRLEHRQSHLTENSVTLGDVVRLQDALKQWIVLGDLVYASGETYLVPGSQTQSNLARGIIKVLQSSPLTVPCLTPLRELTESIKANDGLLEQASSGEPAAHGGSNRFVADWDARSDRAVQLFEDVERTVRIQSAEATMDYESARRVVLIVGTLLSLGYVALVIWLWQWLRRKLAVPLQHITDAAETALRTGEPLHVEDEGPVEVVRMARSANRLTHLLEERVAQRTEALSCEVQERRRAEALAAQARDRAEAGSRAKSEFIANMSHELRTPLNGVLGMADLLGGTELSARQQQFTQVIRLSADSLLSVINDVLDYSRIEAGELQLNLDAFALEDLCDDAVQQIAGSAHKKDLEIVCAIPDRRLGRVIGDGPRLRQVLLNLLGNAVKFTDGGTIELRLACQASTRNTYLLTFEVEDTGIGIAAEYCGTIFESFKQIESGMARRFGGTGLGLTICKRLVSLMQGQIGVRSAPGTGSCFWFTVELPLAAPAPAIAPSEPWLLGLTALVVEANAAACDVLRRQLQDAGMTVATAANFNEGLVQVRAVSQTVPSFDLLVMARPAAADHASHQAAAELQQTTAASLATVIWLDRLDRPEQLAESAAANCRSLNKPLRPRALRDLLERVFPDRTGAARPAPIAPAVADLGSEFNPLGLRVLLVEDNEVNRIVAQNMLENLGCQVVSVAGGYAAIDVVASDSFDIILMDRQMPDIDGLETTRRIRNAEHSSGKRRTPIVAVTANVTTGDREHYLAASLDDYLAKPFSLQQLHDMLRANTRRAVVAAVEAEACEPLRGVIG